MMEYKNFMFKPLSIPLPPGFVFEGDTIIARVNSSAEAKAAIREMLDYIGAGYPFKGIAVMRPLEQ